MRAYVLIPVLCWTLLFVSCEESSAAGEEKKEVEVEEEDGGSGEVFQATSEWKRLPRNRAVPRGIHVRVNLATGEREAKLYDPEDEDKGRISAVTRLKSDRPKLSEGIGPGQLRHVLHKMEGNERAPSEEEIRKVQSKFRSYEQLKKELAKLETEVKTDAEIMADLIGRYTRLVEKRRAERGGGGVSGGGGGGGSGGGGGKGSSPGTVARTATAVAEESEDEEEELDLLTDLEYLVHQFDNAREFVKNGLTTVVLPSLNSTWTRVRAEAARLLGSAVQSNPPAQVAALDSGAIQLLLRTIALDPSAQVRSSALYALSCLVRRFPAAQAKLVEKGGLTVLSKLFESDASHLLKLQVKVITFINDLILEKREAEGVVEKRRVEKEGEVGEEESGEGEEEEGGERPAEERNEAEERLRQYNTIGLSRRLKDEGWCTIVVKILKQDLQGEVDHDRVEKLVTAVASSVEMCSSEFSSELTLLEMVTELEATYAELSSAEPAPSSYFSSLHSLVSALAQRLNRFDVEIIKDEL